MQTDEEEFLRAGLVHYLKAARTVDRFKELIFRRLDETLGGTTSKWTVGREKTGHSAGLGKEPYLEASRRVILTAGGEAMLSVGLAWEGSETYVYAYCSEGPSWMLHPTNRDASQGIKIERHRGSDTLWRACDPANIARDIDTILSDFDRAIQPPAAVKSSGKRRT